MATSLSIQPTGLTLSSIRPVGLPSLTAAATTFIAAAPELDSAPVAFSATGQLLSSMISFLGSLQSLQASAADRRPTGVLGTAQALVDAVNRLQGAVSNLPTLFEALADQPATSNELAALRSAATASLEPLQRIGIELQTAALTDTITGSTLLIDRRILNLAIATDTTGTQALLAEAIQSLIAMANEFESQVADNLPAEEDNLLATLLATGTTEIVDQLAVTTTQTTGPTPATVATAAGVAPPVTPLPVAPPVVIEPALPITTAAPVATPVPAATVAATNAGNVVSEAMRALQRLLADPTAHARKNLFDPAYAGLVAASRLGDFVLRDPAINTKNLMPDFPPPVPPVAAIHGVAAYNEAAESPRKPPAHSIDNQV